MSRAASSRATPAGPPDTAPPPRAPKVVQLERVADLLVRSVDLARSAYARVYRAKGLTELQWVVLRRIRSEEQPPAVGDLSTWLATGGATITALVDRLERRGLVERRPDGADRRRKRLHLTGDALALLAAIDEEAAPSSPCRTLTRRQLSELEVLLSLMEPAPRGS